MISTLANKKVQGIAVSVIGTIICVMFLKNIGGSADLLNVTSLSPASALTLLSAIIGGSTGSLPGPLQSILPQVQATVTYLYSTLGILAALGF